MKKSTPTRSGKFVRYAVASSAALGGAAAANAQFTGTYTIGTPGTYTAGTSVGAFGNWTGGNTVSQLPNQSLTTATTQVSLSYNGYVNPSSAFSFTTTAAAAGTVSFDWSGSRATDGYTGYLVNGSFNALTGASGSVSFAIGSGQSFGFRVGATYFGSGGNAALTLNNFAAPAAIPEPGTTGLLAGAAALGFVGLMSHRARRRRAAASLG